MNAPHQHFVRAPGEEEAVWLLGGLYAYKATGHDTGGRYSVFEVRGPVATPLHSHAAEEEAFYVVSGDVTFVVGEDTVEATSGTFAFVPRGIKHGFRLQSPEARLLLLLTPGNAGHEGLFREMGEPAQRYEVPPPPAEAPDPQVLAEIASRHGTSILGPPLGMDVSTD